MLQGACNPKMVSKSFVSCTDNLPGRRLYRPFSPAGKPARQARPPPTPPMPTEITEGPFYLGGLHSAYVRGEALLAAHRYAEAAAEFQKILDHRGIVSADPIGALAHVLLGRTLALSGDSPKSKIAYQDFFTL